MSICRHITATSVLLAPRGTTLLASILLTASACGSDVQDERPPARRASCAAEAEGADRRCGASGDIDCCGWQEAPGGSFDRLNRDDLPATVSTFRLDVFEVTQGRFRQFVEAYPGSLPEPGQGAHFLYPETGWQEEWTYLVPADRAALSEQLKIDWSDYECLWQDQPGENESVPMECVSWYLAFAFCVWDGGRLPTETEWNYAISGGDEQRTFPWGEDPYDTSLAVYADTETGRLTPAGSAPAGRGRWGHYDFGGSRLEQLLDYASGGSPIPAIEAMPRPCDDCVQITPMVSDWRAVVDIGYPHPPMSTAVRPASSVSPENAHGVVGFRCIYLGDE